MQWQFTLAFSTKYVGLNATRDLELLVLRRNDPYYLGKFKRLKGTQSMELKLTKS